MVLLIATHTLNTLPLWKWLHTELEEKHCQELLLNLKHPAENMPFPRESKFCFL